MRPAGCMHACGMIGGEGGRSCGLGRWRWRVLFQGLLVYWSKA